MKSSIPRYAKEHESCGLPEAAGYLYNAAEEDLERTPEMAECPCTEEETP